jgi:hypothetical protein
MEVKIRKKNYSNILDPFFLGFSRIFWHCVTARNNINGHIENLKKSAGLDRKLVRLSLSVTYSQEPTPRAESCKGLH